MGTITLAGYIWPAALRFLRERPNAGDGGGELAGVERQERRSAAEVECVAGRARELVVVEARARNGDARLLRARGLVPVLVGGADRDDERVRLERGGVEVRGEALERGGDDLGRCVYEERVRDEDRPRRARRERAEARARRVDARPCDCIEEAVPRLQKRWASTSAASASRARSTR